MITLTKKILLTLFLFMSGAMLTHVYGIDLSTLKEIKEGTNTINIPEWTSVSNEYQLSCWNTEYLRKYVATGDGTISICAKGPSNETFWGIIWESDYWDSDYIFSSNLEYLSDSNKRTITYKVSKGQTYVFGIRGYNKKAIDGCTLVLEFESNDITINDKESLSYSEEKKNINIIYNRTFNNTNWQPLFVPFTMVSSDWTSQGLEVACIDNFHEYNSGEEKKIVLEVNKVASGMLYANTPYLIRATETGDKTITLSNATVYKNTTTYPITCSSMKRTYSFVGTYESISSLDADNNLILSGGKLMAMEEGATLSPQRWYVKMEDREAMVDAPTASPTALNIAIQVVGETNVTGIENIHVKEDNAAAPALKGIYDLQGRKLTAVPSKGVFIVDGKKYVK